MFYYFFFWKWFKFIDSKLYLLYKNINIYYLINLIMWNYNLKKLIVEYGILVENIK